MLLPEGAPIPPKNRPETFDFPERFFFFLLLRSIFCFVHFVLCALLRDRLRLGLFECFASIESIGLVLIWSLAPGLSVHMPAHRSSMLGASQQKRVRARGGSGGIVLFCDAAPPYGFWERTKPPPYQTTFTQQPHTSHTQPTNNQTKPPSKHHGALPLRHDRPLEPLLHLLPRPL